MVALNDEKTRYSGVCAERDEVRNRLNQQNEETIELKRKNEALIEETANIRLDLWI